MFAIIVALVKTPRRKHSMVASTVCRKAEVIGVGDQPSAAVATFRFRPAALPAAAQLDLQIDHVFKIIRSRQ
jgi:hypothetical protein